MKRSLFLAVLMVFAVAGAAAASSRCDGATYATQNCPWVGQADKALYPELVAAMRLSSDSYMLGSRSGRWNDGIYLDLRIPRATSPAFGEVRLEIGYEPHWQPREARALEPVAAVLRLGDRNWHSDLIEARPLGPTCRPDRMGFECLPYRVTFADDIVAALLAASDAAAERDLALYRGGARDALHFEILFRDEYGAVVSSDEILQIDSGTCETACAPVLSLVGFAAAFGTAGGPGREAPGP